MGISTQKAKILQHLQRYKTITTFQAMRTYNILRPSNRVQELKADGWNIATEIIYKTRKDGSSTHYAKYTLLGS